jgi:hypothetical protein
MNQTGTNPKPFVFVLMPFDRSFDDIYQLGIKAACHDAGTYCERVDEQIFNESILNRVYNQISKADLLVADMTGRNPNVFYEVGYAHALGKTAILLTQNSDDIPFDLKHFPHIVYKGRIQDLKSELHKRIDWFARNPESPTGEIAHDLRLYIKGIQLEKGNPHKLPCPAKGQIFSINIEVHNSSERTYQTGSFQIGVLTPDFLRSYSGPVEIVTLPEGRLLHMFPAIDRMYPGSWTTFGAEFCYQNVPVEADILLRVFSDLSTDDYPLRLEMMQKDEA